MTSPSWFALLLGGTLSFGALCCQSQPKKKEGAADPPASAAAEQGKRPGVLLRGEPLGDSPRVDFSTLMEQPEKFVGKRVTTSGIVRRACSTKGCWMQLSGEQEGDETGCRVTFKDYGFFVPTDAAGAAATVEAEVQVNVVKPSRVKHYESEGAIFPSKNEDGSANEVRLVATGVELRR